MMFKKPLFIFIVFSFLSLSMLGACGSSDTDPRVEQNVIPVTIDPNLPTAESVSPTVPPETVVDSGYPAPVSDDGYPALEGYPEPENESDQSGVVVGDVDLPQPSEGVGTIGGTLALEIFDDGTYRPASVAALNLATILYDSNGDAAMLRSNDGDLQAEFLDTGGIFIFSNVPPGTYGLMADIGISKFTLTDENGEPIFVTVEQSQVTDMELVLLRLPDVE